MPTEKLSVRKIKEILRLHAQGFSNRQIGRSIRISPGTVCRYLQRAKAAHLSWPEVVSTPEEEIEAQLFQCPLHQPSVTQYDPDLQWIHQELKHKGVTRFLLWQEYKSRFPDGYSYSQFCRAYRSFAQTLSPVMRQTHVAGEKAFVDYSGVTIPYLDSSTGEVKQAEVFVAVLGASNYTFVWASASQNLQDWIMAHVQMFAYFQGVPAIIVPDNLRAGVSKAHLYDPDINPTYQDLANHYGVAIVPTRIAAPQDKAKVEVGVQGIERRIIAPLRHHTFFSLAEINATIAPLLKAYNEQPFQQLPGCRLSQFLTLDKPALRPLPTEKYIFAQWKKVRVNIDYHFIFEKHCYSVPYLYLRKEIDLRITSLTVEGFYRGKWIVLHPRASRPGYTTVKEHMPQAHQEYAQWTPQRLLQWAEKIGPATQQLIQQVIATRPFPQQAYRACLGILRLGNTYGQQRLECAAQRALCIGALRYQSVASILKLGLDQQPLPDLNTTAVVTPNRHDNIRGAFYYQ